MLSVNYNKDIIVEHIQQIGNLDLSSYNNVFIVGVPIHHRAEFCSACILCDCHRLPPPTTDRHWKVLSQYLVTESHRLLLSLPLSATVHCCLPPSNRCSPPQSISLELLKILRSFKTCCSFWMNARDIFANDVQRWFDSTQKIVSLQQTNHDMVSHIANARVAVEELKGLLPLVVEEEAVRILQEYYEIVKVVVPNKIANISLSDTPSNGRPSSILISNEEYHEFLRLKSNNHTQSSASPSVSTACISQPLGSQGPWIIDSGASDHISGNDSVFSSIFSPNGSPRGLINVMVSPTRLLLINATILSLNAVVTSPSSPLTITAKNVSYEPDFP
ncbi:hypothetical protein CR513_00133, partial [Mucuna pruriens]